MRCGVYLQGKTGPKDLVGKTVFTFGAQKKGGDFYVPCDRMKAHSQLVLHPNGRISISFCNAQVMPFVLYHVLSFWQASECQRLPACKFLQLAPCTLDMAFGFGLAAVVAYTAVLCRAPCLGFWSDGAWMDHGTYLSDFGEGSSCNM